MATLKEKLRERALRLPIWFHVVINVGALGLAVTWWATYTGGYRWLAERQLEWSGSYGLNFTGIMVILVCMISGAVVTQIAASLVPDRSDSERQATEDLGARMDAAANWMSRNTYLLLMTGLTIGLAAIGGFMLFQARTEGKMVSVGADTLERGGAPAGHFAHLEGRQLWDDSVTFEMQGGDSPGVKTVIPVVSASWQRGQAVAAFVRFKDDDVKKILRDTLETGKPPALTGLLADDDLEGIARTDLERKGIAVAGRHFVLDYGVTPEHREGLGKFLLAGSGVTAPIVLVVWLVKRRRRNDG